MPYCIGFQQGKDPNAPPENDFGPPGPLTWEPMKSSAGGWDLCEEELAPLRRLPATHARIQEIIASKGTVQ